MLKHFEHRGQNLISPTHFRHRLFIYSVQALFVIATALGIGMSGYHYFEGLTWIDSFLNAAMILGGMGPVNQIESSAGKIFAGAYALFSGIIFIVVAGLLFSPIAHRILHRFHIEDETGNQDDD